MVDGNDVAENGPFAVSDSLVRVYWYEIAFGPNLHILVMPLME